MLRYITPVREDQAEALRCSFRARFPEYLRPTGVFTSIYTVPVVAVVMLQSLCFVQADKFVLRCKPF